MTSNLFLLKDLLTITKDGEWGKGEPDHGLVEMAVIRGTDFDAVRFGDIRTVPIRYIPEPIAVRKNLQPGDILIETAGGTKDQPTGRTVFLKEKLFKEHNRPFTCASFSRFLRIDSTLADSEYVYWYLKYLYHTGEMYLYHVQHTGVARFQYTDFASRTYIPLPPLAEQRAIAHILGSLDDKIELNRRMNETLETMARALFHDWFVDFGPVRAKMAGREPPGLSAEIAALFPAALDGAGKPEGWEILSLDKIADFLNGLALQKFPGSAADDLPVIKIAELRAGFVGDGVRASKTIPSQYVVEDGDVVFSWSGSLIQRIWTGGRGALNQHLFKVTSTRFPKWFHYYWVEHHLPNFQAIAASKATTMGHIQRYHLTEAKTIVGNEALMKAADDLFAPVFNQIVANSLESRTLATLRDLLLPKLLSGELRASDAEGIIGVAL